MIFDPAAAVLVVPALAAALLVTLPGYRLPAALNVIAALLTFSAAVSLFFERPQPGSYLLVDDLNIVFIVLTTFVGFTTSVFSASYIGHELETGRLTPSFLRFYHAMYQVLMFAMNLALLANNIGVMWVAIELATLTTVLMVGIYRTHEALEAAWKYFILCSVGIALALFGTILVYMAARPVIGEGVDAMVWSVLVTRAAEFDPELLNVAFVFLLLGYGTKVGLAPLHAWLPDAHAEGPTPISAVLSGLLLNVALYALLRFKMLLALNPAALAPGPLMVTMGLISLIFAAFMLYRRRDIKRMFAYSSIEHMGIITFAFGMGGPLANFAGLLHMTMHSLTKSAIFFAVGHCAGQGYPAHRRDGRPHRDQSGAGMGPRAGSGRHCRDAAARDLHERIPGSDIDVCAPAVAGSRARSRHPDWCRGPVPAIECRRIRRAARSYRESKGLLCADVRASGAGVRRRHLSAAHTRCLVSERGQAVGIAPMPKFVDGIDGSRVTVHRPWPRLVVNEDGWRSATDALATGRLTLLGLWGDAGAVHMAVLEEREVAVVTLECPSGHFPSVAARHAPAIRLERALQDLFGLEPVGLPDPRPWLDLGFWDVRHPLAAAGGASPLRAPYAFLPTEGDDLHQIPVGPVHAGIIEPGHFRFTANGETVVRLEQRLGYVHKGIESLMAGAPLDKAARLAGRTSGDSTVAYALAFAQAVEAATGVEVPARAVYLRALMAELERLANHFGDFGAICNDASFSIMHAECGVLRERTLRCADSCFGHRLMMDGVVPGGVARDLGADCSALVSALLAEVRAVFPKLIELYDNTASLQDRTVTTGILRAELAKQFGAGGYVGRGSGRGFDARKSLRCPPYDRLDFEVPVFEAGDVNARVWVRIREIEQSLGLIDQILRRLPGGAIRADVDPGGDLREGLAIVESFRGDVLVWVRLAHGVVARCHLRDPSWFQWPLLEAAIEDNIVADFPLCNKSFNCSYSGHDL
jgi:Ni,Fe-hydrogenase III large subunit/NADH:ubiquinone oxidoreductase subunit 2 (subunit N)